MVCSELGLYLTSTGKTLPIYAMGRREDPTRTGSEVSQITLNTDARDAIRDLFPNIPDQDLNQIIKTAFQKVCIPLSFKCRGRENPDTQVRARRKLGQPLSCLWPAERSLQ